MTHLRVTLLCMLALIVCSIAHAATPKYSLTLHGNGNPSLEVLGGQLWGCRTWSLNNTGTQIVQICQQTESKAPKKPAPKKKGGLSA